MKLTELARQVGIDPAEAFRILVNSSESLATGAWTPWFQVYVASETFDIYQLVIPGQLVEQAREVLLRGAAQEVIDHAKGGREHAKNEEDDLG